MSKAEENWKSAATVVEQPEMTEAEKREAYQAAIDEVNEKFGYRIEARIVPVPNSNFVQAEPVAVKVNV